MFYRINHRPAILFLLSVCLFTAAVRLWPQTPADASLVIQGGAVVDVRRGTLLPNSTVVIQGERITQVGAVGQVSIPANARVIKADGKFIMPGLWDSHAHTRDFDGILNINHGVTSTMDMGNILDWIVVMAELREKGASFGPRIFPDGMVIAGLLGPHEWAAKDSEEGIWAARKNIDAGVSFLKVYQEATPEIIRAVAQEAHKAGLNLTGHLRKSDAREAILAGINGLAHGSGIAAATTPPEVARKIKNNELSNLGYSVVDANYLQDPAMFDDLIKLMIDRDVRLEPNFVAMFKGIFPQWEKFFGEEMNLAMEKNLHIPETFYHAWAAHFPFELPLAVAAAAGKAESGYSTEAASAAGSSKTELIEKLKKGYANHQLFMRKFAAAGGKLLVGTDAWYIAAPGLAVWHEMELMKDAGIPTLSILQGATINPAEFVHQDKNLATIEKGKLADLIILARNPLQDVSNVRSLETVIQHGKVQKLGYWSEYRNPVPRPYQVVPGQFPRPYISSVQPAVVPTGSEKVVLTIKGRDFNSENRVLFNGVDLEVLKATKTEVQAVVPPESLKQIGTYKVTMITAGTEPETSWNFGEVIVSLGRKFNERWNGQKRNTEF